MVRDDVAHLVLVAILALTLLHGAPLDVGDGQQALSITVLHVDAMGQVRPVVDVPVDFASWDSEGQLLLYKRLWTDEAGQAAMVVPDKGGDIIIGFWYPSTCREVRPILPPEHTAKGINLTARLTGDCGTIKDVGGFVDSSPWQGTQEK